MQKNGRSSLIRRVVCEWRVAKNDTKRLFAKIHNEFTSPATRNGAAAELAAIGLSAVTFYATLRLMHADPPTGTGIIDDQLIGAGLSAILASGVYLSTGMGGEALLNKVRPPSSPRVAEPPNARPG